MKPRKPFLQEQFKQADKYLRNQLRYSAKTQASFAKFEEKLDLVATLRPDIKWSAWISSVSARVEVESMKDTLPLLETLEKILGVECRSYDSAGYRVFTFGSKPTITIEVYPKDDSEKCKRVPDGFETYQKYKLVCEE